MPWQCIWCGAEHHNGVQKCDTWSCRKIRGEDTSVPRGKSKGRGKGRGKGKGKQEVKPVWDCKCGAQFNFYWRDTCRVCKGKKEDNEVKEVPPQEKGNDQLTLRQSFAKLVVKEAEKLRGEDSATTVDSSADSQQEERKQLQAEITQLDATISVNAH